MKIYIRIMSVIAFLPMILIFLFSISILTGIISRDILNSSVVIGIFWVPTSLIPLGNLIILSIYYGVKNKFLLHEFIITGVLCFLEIVTLFLALVPIGYM